jgi:hypothetical protein
MHHGRLQKAFILTALLSALFGHARAAVDQEALPVFGAFNTASANLAWQQEVTAGLEGDLIRVDLFTGVFPGTFRFFVNDGSAWQTDADDFSIVLSPAANASVSIDVSPAHLHLSPGEVFVVGVEGLVPNGNCCGLRAGQYDRGGLYLMAYHSGKVNSEGDIDFAFRTYVDAVPEPSTFASFVTGLGVLGFARCRR